LKFLGDAPSYNVVFFNEVFDCTGLDIGLDSLVAQVRGLARPVVMNGPGFLSKSAGARGALIKFLKDAQCPLRSRLSGSPMPLRRPAICRRGQAAAAPAQAAPPAQAASR